MKQDAEYYFKQSRAKWYNRDNWDVQGSLADLDRAIQLDPENLEYRRIRGDLRHFSDKHQEAIEDLTKIIETSKDMDELAAAYSKRASSHEHLGRIDELLEDLDWLIEHGFDSGDRYSWRGFHRLQSGDTEGAIRDFTAAHRLMPENYDALLQRAQAFYKAKNYPEAIKDLDRILAEKEKQNPLHLAVVYYWRAKARYKLDLSDDALNDFNEAMRLRDGKPVDMLTDETLNRFYEN